MRFIHPVLFVVISLAAIGVQAQPITTAGQPAQLDIRVAGEHSIRITLKPISLKENFPFTPALAVRDYPAPAISLREMTGTIKKQLGSLRVEVRPHPLTVTVTNIRGQMVQQMTFLNDGNLSFRFTDQPVLGMGE